MKYEVVISSKALEDIQDIYLHIATVLQAPVNAKRQLERLRDSIFSLDFLPERYRIYNRNDSITNLHIMPVDNYIVLYTLESETKRVEIVRVLYGGRDIEKIL